MNYGEELTYWYLRLNGFFPISNFVVHKSQSVLYSSDVDLLAVRPPYVFEEIGGRPEDWDEYLTENLDFGRQVGLICEVKTGRFKEARIFRAEQLHYTLPRLGLVAQKEVEQILETLKMSPSINIGGATIAKLFISEAEHTNGPYLNRTLQQIEDFLADRVRRYPLEKYADRMFFPSHTFQFIIAQVYRSIEKRKTG
ncbi:MAG: hypothetical protein KKD63_15755 [Proteobacteria bacterium]|nr:hypothetical protein [Desulfobulbaceae bacterium]MBU4154325.1 hypothetical protein [Pseudomonadota bacterium]